MAFRYVFQQPYNPSHGIIIESNKAGDSIRTPTGNSGVPDFTGSRIILRPAPILVLGLQNKIKASEKAQMIYCFFGRCVHLSQKAQFGMGRTIVKSTVFPITLVINVFLL